MMQGEDSSQIVKKRILKMSYKAKELSFSMYLEAKIASRVTLSKYLKELIQEGLLAKIPGSIDESFHPKYVITSKGLEKYFEENTAEFTKAINLIRGEAQWKPTKEEFETGHISAERVKEMEKHQNLALKSLSKQVFFTAKNHIFALGFTGVRPDLGNVNVTFKNGEPSYCIMPDRGQEP